MATQRINYENYAITTATIREVLDGIRAEDAVRVAFPQEENTNKGIYCKMDVYELFHSDSLEVKQNKAKSIMIEINNLSWNLFEQTKTFGANCIDLYSIKMAKFFDMLDMLTDNIKFNTNIEYEKDSYCIGNLNNRYNVFFS